MNSLARLVDRLRLIPILAVAESEASWSVEIKKGEGLAFEVVLPKSVQEWFVCAKRDGKEIWSDWAEHYATRGESKEQLEEERIRDVEDFIGRVVKARFLASPGAGGSTILMWEQPGGPKPVGLYE